MNHNILKKIIDKMALEKWKDRVKKINNLYHHFFILDEKIHSLNNKGEYGGVVCGQCAFVIIEWFCYNYRPSNIDDYPNMKTIYHHRLTRCKSCDIGYIDESIWTGITCPDYREKIE